MPERDFSYIIGYLTYAHKCGGPLRIGSTLVCGNQKGRKLSELHTLCFQLLAFGGPLVHRTRRYVQIVPFSKCTNTFLMFLRFDAGNIGLFSKVHCQYWNYIRLELADSKFLITIPF